MSVTIWEPTDGPHQPKERPSLIVYPLAVNKRPVGFAPWPEPKKPKRKKSA